MRAMWSTITRAAEGASRRRFALIWLTLALVLAASDASADARICTSGDVLTFGNRLLGSSTTLSATVFNCGDLSWTFTDVSVDPATGPAFHVTATCATGLSLAPGASCAVGVTFAPTATGQTSGGLWLHNTTSTPDPLITFYGRGIDASAGSAALAFAPAIAAFGAQALGVESPPLTVQLSNLGPAALTPSAMVLNGPDVYDFRGEAGSCGVGITIAAGGSCQLQLYFRPQTIGARLANLVIDAPQLANLAILVIDGDGVTIASDSIPVVEFYNATLNHYFLTASAQEAALIDQGAVGPGWVRTGFSFRAWAQDGPAPATAAPVCRFFGTPGIGPSSHFFTADAAECAAVEANPHWIYEGVAFRTLAATPACAPGTDPIERFYWPGRDVTELRHRYVADATDAARMRQAGWIDEGPVFCSPR